LRGWRIGFVSASVQFLLEANALSDTKKQIARLADWLCFSICAPVIPVGAGSSPGPYRGVWFRSADGNTATDIYWGCD
jgi:hypothetical protein